MHRFNQRMRISDIAAHLFDLYIPNTAQVGLWANEYAARHTALDQRSRQIGTDTSRPSGDEHRALNVNPVTGHVNQRRRTRAASLAKYVRMRSAPARLIPISISIITRSSSIHPFCPAAFTIEYSPLTLYAAVGI